MTATLVPTLRLLSIEGLVLVLFRQLVEQRKHRPFCPVGKVDKVFEKAG